MHSSGTVRLFKIVDITYLDFVALCKFSKTKHVIPVKILPDMTYSVFGGTLNLAQSINHVIHYSTKSVTCIGTMNISLHVCLSVCVYISFTVSKQHHF